jgi:hypothetical protein
MGLKPGQEFKSFTGLWDKIPLGAVFAYFEKMLIANKSYGVYVYDPAMEHPDGKIWFIRGTEKWIPVVRADRPMVEGPIRKGGNNV